MRGHQKTARVAVSFEAAMFERIAGEAARRGIPFAQIVRERVLQAYRVSEDAKAAAPAPHPNLESQP
jgi:hypothetical protein